VTSRRALALALIGASIVTAAAAAARADSGGAELVRVPLGAAVQVKLAEQLVGGLICDDLTVVRPEIVIQAGTWIRFTGLKEGATVCAVNHLYIRRRLFQVVVFAPRRGGPARRR
jgi:hypothetical protein